jgi:ferric-dicitrate binding protein FerR (iron transport regulator)
MNTSEFLPASDLDLKLAKALGKALESDEGLSSVQDPLLQELEVFKRSSINEVLNTSEHDSQTMWANIEQQTINQAKTYQAAPVHTLKTRSINYRVWATAATVLIAAFIGLFWMTNQPTMVLKGESFAQIEQVTLEDGSTVTLRPYSKLYSTDNNPTNRAYTIEGEAFFNVVSMPEHPFSVESIHGTVTVLGTRFNMSTWGEETLVYLEEGSVQLNSLSDQELILKPGESAKLKTSGNIESLESTSATFLDWMNQVLVLERTPLASALNEIEQHYQIKITFTDSALENELITGSIELSTVDSTLQDLGIILNGTFRLTNTDEYRFISLN